MNLFKIKYDRLREVDRFFLDIFNGLKNVIDNKNTDRIFYKKDDKLMFEYDQKNQILWYSYDYIRVVLRDKFELDYLYSTDLVQYMVEAHLKLSVKSTRNSRYYGFCRWEQITI